MRTIDDPRTRISVAVAATLVLASTVVVALGGPASSQTGPNTTCADAVLTLQAGFGDRGLTIYSDANLGPAMREFDLAAPVPAGAYTASAVSYDGYTDRAASVEQPNEQWLVELLDASGNVLATTSPTADLADGVIEATWSGSIGNISWAGAEATKVRVHHAAPPGATSPNSVEPVCVGLTADDPITAASVTTTSIAPKASTTTTTAPVQVLPQVTTRTATPQVGNPNFTG